MEKYYKKFLDFIKTNNLITENDKIVIAVSGGIDSIVLALLLNEIKEKLKLKLLIAHLNHKIRGKEADLDEVFVKDFAKDLNIRFISKSINIPRVKKENSNKSLEEIARVERYKFLQEVCKNSKFNKIATGHHLNDSIENFFLTVLIGGSLKGLAGVPAKTKNIIRPLLCFTRNDLEKIINFYNIPARTDSSNFDVNIPRNWVRNKLIPFIKNEFKPFENNLINLIDIIKSENEFLNIEAENIINQISYEYGIKINTNILTNSHISVLRRVIYEILNIIGHPNITYNLINLISNSLNLRYIRINDIIIWTYNKYTYFTLKNSINKYNYSLLKETGIEIKEVKSYVSKKLIHKKVDKYIKSCIYINNNKNIKNIFIRSRKKGDKIELMNTDYLKSIKELFIDLKIPKVLRDIIPIIEIDGNVAGIYLNFPPVNLTNKISEKYKITDETKKTLILEFKEKL